MDWRTKTGIALLSFAALFGMHSCHTWYSNLFSPNDDPDEPDVKIEETIDIDSLENLIPPEYAIKSVPPIEWRRPIIHYALHEIADMDDDGIPEIEGYRNVLSSLGIYHDNNESLKQLEAKLAYNVEGVSDTNYSIWRFIIGQMPQSMQDKKNINEFERRVIAEYFDYVRNQDREV